MNPGHGWTDYQQRQWLYGHWLVSSGHEVGDAPVFEEYLNNPRNTAPSDLLTDICLPLARAPVPWHGQPAVPR